MIKEVVIVSGARTAIGSFGGSLKTVPAVDLGALVMREALKKANLKPVSDNDMECAAPDKLQGRGQVEIEKKAWQYDENAQPVVVDETIVGNVLQASQGQSPGRQVVWEWQCSWNADTRLSIIPSTWER